MRRTPIVLAILFGAVAVGCADRPPARTMGDDPSPAEPPASSGRQRYQASATVLQAPGAPAKLCLGAIAESLPPQCGTMPIPNWDWDAVEGEERLSGTTWGQYRLVGTYDGASFTVLEVGPPRRPGHQHTDPIQIPCPPPVEGWVAADRSRTSDGDLRAAGALASSQPDSAGWWIKILEESQTEGPYGPNDIVLNAAFTGEVERHRQELAEVWGGPLCVARYERTEAELSEIQHELTARGAGEFGLEILVTSVDVVRNQVDVEVVVFDQATAAAIDQRYGEGTVRLTAALDTLA